MKNRWSVWAQVKGVWYEEVFEQYRAALKVAKDLREMGFKCVVESSKKRKWVLK